MNMRRQKIFKNIITLVVLFFAGFGGYSIVNVSVNDYLLERDSKTIKAVLIDVIKSVKRDGSLSVSIDDGNGNQARVVLVEKIEELKSSGK